MHNESSATKKRRIRTEVRKARRALSRREVRRKSQAAARFVARTGAFHRAERVAFYLAADGELDPRYLVERARKLGKRCFLPVIDTKLGGRLAFAPYTPDTPLLPNRFGIPEPAVPRAFWVGPRRLDVIYAPLVAFTPEGGRLGMGGGFYDRTLAHRRHLTLWRRPRVFGLALELQKREWLPEEPWDIPVDGVASEAGLYPGWSSFR
ncbi:MAG: 5-formyltetrahydrofolate cyclo-ligase [Thiohalorhabdus sp.]|uniref:5-formyltetrahydrofolate cyclo-ligase n=1 Tax=Thiohalorhabdus sp. TaxID=3094134 RepID=UPI003980EA0F